MIADDMQQNGTNVSRASANRLALFILKNVNVPIASQR